MASCISLSCVNNFWFTLSVLLLKYHKRFFINLFTSTFHEVKNINSNRFNSNMFSLNYYYFHYSMSSMFIVTTNMRFCCVVLVVFCYSFPSLFCWLIYTSDFTITNIVGYLRYYVNIKYINKEYLQRYFHLL